MSWVVGKLGVVSKGIKASLGLLEIEWNKGKLGAVSIGVRHAWGC
jgi:hypothetical protein